MTYYSYIIAHPSLTYGNFIMNSPRFPHPEHPLHLDGPHHRQDQTHQASSPGQLPAGGGDVAPENRHWASVFLAAEP